MNNLLERFIKRNNKKRGINITVATIVMFLLSCTGIYAATIIDKNEKENILYVGANGANTYKWGNNGIYYNIDSSDSKLIINGRLEAGNNTQSLEISSNAKDVTVENNGFIDGVTVGRDYDSIKTNAKFINNGIITNEGNALVIYSNKANVSNYGIIKASGQNEKTKEYYKGVVLANGGNFNNYGIVIDGDGKISNVGASNQQVTMDNGITYTVKNAVDSSSGTAQVITMNGTDGNKAFDKYILNGLDETIKVTTTGNTVSNSVVNSLDNAINITSGAELGLGSTTVNGNIAINGGTLTLTDINNKINGNVSGTTDNDIIKLGYQVDSNTNYTNLNTILKGSGVDTLKFSDNGNTIDTTKISVVGKFEGGIGADTFIVNGANYTIDGGDGEDTLSLSTAYNSNLSNFKNISNIETLQLANTTNEITIDSNPANFTTIKGGTGNDSFVLTGNSGINLIGGSGINTLKLNNSLNSINYAGVLGAEGEKWNLVVNNLTKDVTLTQGNIKGNIESLKIDTGIKTVDETTKLVSLLTTYNIENATFNNNQADILTFTGTDVKGTRTFTINQGDTVNMSGNITGNYNFKTVGTFTPTINLSSGTTFTEGTKITSTNGIKLNIENRKQLTLGTLTYSNNGFTYSGSNPFDSNTRYTITGNIKLNVEGITGDKLGAGNNLGQVTNSTYNNNITVKGNIDIPVFLKYSNGSFFVKSWGEIDSSEGSAFLEGTYNNMLKQYSSNEAIKAALNNWSKDGIISYIKGSEITDYTFNLNGQTYKNTLIANNGLSKEFKLEGTTGGSITFRDIATSDNLTLNLTGTNQSNILLDENVNIGGDINFGNSENVNLTINARSTSSTVKNILGNDKNSNIKLTHVQIVGNNSNDGKIDLGAGTDTLTLNNVGVNSITGSGKNTLELNQGSNVGTISLSKNSTSAISLMALDVDSSIDNNITVNDGATVGTIDLSSAGNSLVTLNSGKITNVKFGSGNDMLTYNGGNISSVDFGAGDNVLNVRADLDLSNTKISVAEGGTLRNTLNVGKLSSRSTSSEDSVTIGGNFSAFNEVNIQGTTKLNSNLVLSNGTSVNFNGNTVIAGLNTANGVTTTVLDGTKVIGSNGTLLLDTSSVGLNTNISFANIEGMETLAGVESNYVGYSLVKDSNGNYVVEINKDLASGEDSDIIQAILGAAGLPNELTGSYEEQIKILNVLKEDTKYSTAYAYSNIVSRKTAEMVNNAVMNFDLKADKNQWLAYGSILGSGKEIKDYYTGATGVGSNIDTDIQGAYVQAEYGYTDNTALGFVVAGNKTDSDIGKSSLKGNGAYLGAYVKHNVKENIQVIGGIAYQNNSYESDRVVGDSQKEFRHAKDYSDNTITGYISGKYEYKFSDSLVLEPNTRLNITHVSQDSISENKNETLNIETNKKSFTTVSGETGVDLVKKIATEKGTIKLKTGTSLGYLLSGADGKKVTATMGDTAFNIATPDQDKTNVKFKVGAQYEKESGVLYNVEGSYITSSKEKEWVVGAGIGYRF
ncbi:autotransporter domain-containing protein [Fusobacterium mortiferum]|uniref:Autotransporter outer membrane beta-barrel domain-containing protein n=1 Tax=Fusobacterium mortiferum TaxID=850 RepID=A0ABS2G516_FUSMR|nr:autotransporter outer membrane beta-barrel domain-containing protein [Fusobacterium mortiferum]MBM6875794.1 autotransporter outer membrane beta-barrel domain-containing protein [Fusobacterium mortiferum]